jgi:hypothetical protein
MSKILISYRREDSIDVTGRIHDRLVRDFGSGAVFMDVDSIPYGVDFRTYLDEQVSQCEVFLAVIGRDWLRSKERKGRSRLEDPGDFVRIEIESALKRRIPVIPVLVGGASVPPAQQLPASIQDLSYRHAIVIRPNPDFHRDMDHRLFTDPARSGKGTACAQESSEHGERSEWDRTYWQFRRQASGGGGS